MYAAPTNALNSTIGNDANFSLADFDCSNISSGVSMHIESLVVHIFLTARQKMAVLRCCVFKKIGNVDEQYSCPCISQQFF